MRRLLFSLFAAASAVPGLALGQTLKPADLVGTWVIPRDGKWWADSLQGKLMVSMLTLNADGSYNRATKMRAGDSLVAIWGQVRSSTDTGPQRWDLAGDTLWFDGRRWDSRKILLKDGKLFVWNWLMWDADRRDDKCADETYQRLESPRLLALPPPPQVTIKAADIVGTWAGRFDTKRFGVVTDTLVIRLDHTLQTWHLGPVDDVNGVRGTWALLPGDVLTGPLGNIDRVTIYLRHGELVRCHYNYAVLKRVAP